MRYDDTPDAATDDSLAPESINDDQPDPFISDPQADAIVAALYKWLVDTPWTIDTPHLRDRARSTVAAIICDAVSDDISLQPLHAAYDRRRQYLTAATDPRRI